jgi:hypothetical protein
MGSDFGGLDPIFYFSCKKLKKKIYGEEKPLRNVPNLAGTGAQVPSPIQESNLQWRSFVIPDSIVR